MDRKFLHKLQRSFGKRGGTFGVAPDATPESISALLGELLECADCRAAILEACNADDRKDVDIDAVIRDLAMSRGH
jgi:hypothetical protein